MALTRYGELRNRLMRQSFPNIFAPVVLRDADSNYVPIPISERLVQCIWYDQRLKHEELRTTDGRRVRVIFQGWWNLEAGPDFRHATIQIDDEAERTGDIELHLRAEDWNHHHHEHDAHFNDVILHVVLWEAGSQHVSRTRAGQIIPQIVIQHQLDTALEQLYDEIDLDSYPHNAGNHHGQCAHVLRALPSVSLAAMLDAAGDERFAAKVRRFTRWIHRVGPEQAFYEGWMEALGYKANKAAFRTLAQRVPLAELNDHRAHLAPILFGLANFCQPVFPIARLGGCPLRQATLERVVENSSRFRGANSFARSMAIWRCPPGEPSAPAPRRSHRATEETPPLHGEGCRRDSKRRRSREVVFRNPRRVLEPSLLLGQPDAVAFERIDWTESRAGNRDQHRATVRGRLRGE